MLCVGLTTVDVSQLVVEFPAPGEKVRSLDVHLVPGGPAANASRAVAALGHEAVLVTALGDDLGEFARRRLVGVEVHDAGPGGPAVSMVAVRERDGERTVVSRNAATFRDTGFDLAPLVARADVVLVDGHLPELALEAARRAAVPVVLDAGSWKPVHGELLPLVDVAACSASYPLTARGLHERGVPLVVRTHGAGPVTWSTGTRTGRVPVRPVEARDTNGAGDVWHGALAVAFAEGLAVEEAVARANEVAAVRVAHTALDWVEEVERWRR
ncbi:PfkB family carbohydrate kinase [Actinosynnema sp. NPDC020468]|uniref:PfkB family carbohydrate kinase n=1 Tax=Actinosynnema sp. NPDC020468 TaxID=3154488 RepID=UPI0033EC2DD5